MKQSFTRNWRNLFVLGALAAVGCEPGLVDKAGDLESQTPDSAVTDGEFTGEVRSVFVGENQQTLVVGPDGDLVEACSISYSRCTGASSNRGFEQCARSVLNPGTEDWFQGVCPSGRTCRQDGLEATCGTTAPSTRTVNCTDLSNGQLRVTVTGPLSGGTIVTPANPYRLLYVMDEDGRNDGWELPYPSGTSRTYVAASSSSLVNGSGTAQLTMPEETGNFQLYWQDRNVTPTDGPFTSSNAGNFYFRLADSTWTTTGVCRKAQTSRGWVFQRTTAPDPDPDPTPQGPGTVFCERTSNRLRVTIEGPVLSRLVLARQGVSFSNPRYIEYGSNQPTALWNTTTIHTQSMQSSNPRAHADWTSDGATYVLELPSNASAFNFFVRSSTGVINWADLLERDDGELPWTIEGDDNDCYLNGDLIYQK